MPSFPVLLLLHILLALPLLHSPECVFFSCATHIGTWLSWVTFLAFRPLFTLIALHKSGYTKYVISQSRGTQVRNSLHPFLWVQSVQVFLSFLCCPLFQQFPVIHAHVSIVWHVYTLSSYALVVLEVQGLH